MLHEKNHNPNVGTEACQQFDRELAAYLDGEDRPEVLAHAGTCLFCGVVLEDLRAVISGSGALPRPEPPARVWANIRATLVAEGVIHEPVNVWRRWFAPLGFVWRPAPALALVGLLVLAVSLTVPRPGSVPTSTHPPSPGTTQNEAVVSRAVSGENQALARTVDGLERDYQARKTSLDPGVAATYEKGLASLNDSIREASVSVEREPNNSLAREYLVGAYQQKAQVLTAALEYDNR